MLIVFKEGSRVPANVLIEQAVRGELRDHRVHGVEVFTEYLDASRFSSVSHYRLFRDYLSEKYRHQRPDVMLTTVGFEVAELSAPELISGVPVVRISPNPMPSVAPSLSLSSNITASIACFDFRGTLDLVFRLQPDSRRIVVIGGVSSSARNLLREVGKASQSFTNQAGFEFWTNQPMADLQAAVGRLPGDTVVLYTMIFQDVTGQTFVPAEALKSILEHASVPVYVLVDSQLGSGAVGGSLLSYDRLGASAGKTARRILDGAPVASLPVTVLTNGTPMFDWRALRRWGIDEGRLPSGSVVLFRELSFWERFRWLILGVIVFCGAQTALIVGLIVNRAKRRQGEVEAALTADISSKFVHLPPGEVDPKIQDALRRICELLGIEVSALWQWSREASDTMVLTHLQGTVIAPLPEAVQASDYFPWCQQQMLAARTVSFSSLDELPPEAARDRESYRRFGIKSTVTIPLSVGGELPIGALGFSTTGVERGWPASLVERLEVIAQIFASALARKRSDHQLRESEEVNRATFEQAAVGMAHIGTDGRWLRVNDKLCAIIGYSREELRQLTFQEITYPDDLEEDLNCVRKLLAGEIKSCSMEKRYFRKDRSLVWVNRTVSLVRNEAGKSRHFISVLEDITQRKVAETELLRQRAELAHVARVSTLGELAASVAHELNQPLGAILANAEAAELFLEQEPPALDDLRAILADIRKDDERAGEVIRRMRALLQKRELERRPVDVNSLAQETLQLVRADAMLRGVTFHADLAAVLPEITGDRVHLQQVLLNLMINAMDAVTGEPREQRRIVVRTRRGADGKVELTVIDSGHGIEPGTLARLFDPFYTTKPNGMGMGLSIARTIIEAHQGRIRAENNPAGGAMFRIELPVEGKTVISDQ
ncbi:MAG: PAS domain S-box protein [Verrucomicrobia bacterium]|nr:PAS domain S-box protein [Verrucomicrobiota bacterium]